MASDIPPPFAALNLPSPEEYHKRKVALISGITGQDGSYLVIRSMESFVDPPALTQVVCTICTRINTNVRTSSSSTTAISATALTLYTSSLKFSLRKIYNLGAQSHVKVSFEMAEYTGDVDGLGTLRLLDAIRTCGLEKHVRFYQASTSELYGKVVETPQTEKTPFYPRSPYGCAKLYAFWIVVNYREAYGLYACNGILFNHESPRRGRTFVTRKITRAAAEISVGKQECLYLGNLDAQRDWGHARDYVEGMWRMLQQPVAEDFVLATGETHPVREFIEKSFSHLGIQLEWSGEGVNEEAKDVKTGQVVVKVDPRYFRPAEVDLLLGNPAKAEGVLGWKRQVDFDSLVKEMVDADLVAVKSLVEDQN
ncbi:hypothetical protein AAF712_001816 [Marasmius tenuissimus]|uniref:GDP-mannose 4,6-dehydratase n=1 Tax=Marasmius tenuissimus TaxID=585030 RepID=A0ABR3ABA5_9AGAR